MRFVCITLCVCAAAFGSVQSDQEGLLPYLENLMADKISEFTGFFENFNDQNVGKSAWGRLINYEKAKPLLKETGKSKKHMAMLPMIFHVGAASTWMILTAIMATKSVAIGLMLLIFKIAVSAAKLASFFTLLKHKKSDHHEYSWAPAPHYEHHHHVTQGFGTEEASIDPRVGKKKKKINGSEGHYERSLKIYDSKRTPVYKSDKSHKQQSLKNIRR